MPWAGEVWWATARPVDDRLLDAATRARLAAMRRPDDRDRHATAVRLSDLLVRSRAGDGARVHRRRGAPPQVVGADAPLHLSVSHAGPYVAVAIGPHPLGVDVEEVGADIEWTAAVMVASGEAEAVAALPSADRQAALLRLWVRKEAVLKAAGVGLTVDPRLVALSDGPGGPVVAAAPPLPIAGEIMVRDLTGPAGSVSALAGIGGPVAGVTEHDGDAAIAAAGS